MPAELLRMYEMGADQFADDITIRGDFEYAPFIAFTDQRVATRQPLGTAHMWREEGCHVVPRAIAPLDLVGGRVYFPDLAVMQVARIGAICKNQDIAIRQKLRVMLAAHVVILVPPDHLVGGLINDKQQTQVF